MSEKKLCPLCNKPIRWFQRTFFVWLKAQDETKVEVHVDCAMENLSDKYKSPRG